MASWTVWVLLLCTQTNLHLQIQLVGWSNFLDCRALLPLNEVNHAFADDIMSDAPASDLTLLWSLQTTFLKTTLMWILNSYPRCGLKCRMCLEQYLIPTMALRLIIVRWTLNSMWNIPTYTCLWMYWRKQQTAYVAMNSSNQIKSNCIWRHNN